MKLRFLNKNGLVDSTGCVVDAPNGCFLAMTPNAYDAPRAIHTRMDKPSQVSGVNSTNIYTNPALENYNAGLNSRPWSQMNNAQITYYIDEGIQYPFFSPVFIQDTFNYESYTDPMSSWKPHYNLVQTNSESTSNLSWIVDSTYHRQDLMSKQMAVQNQRRSEPFL